MKLSSRGMDRQTKVLIEAIRLLARRCPRLARTCYWAGTSCIAIEELGHRQSFDLDFHTRKALDDVRPVLAEIQKAFPGKFEIAQAPDEFGSNFRGVLTLSRRESITVEVLSNHEDAQPKDLVRSVKAPGFLRVSLARYLADKMQCVCERAEARDLLDIGAVLRCHPSMTATIQKLLAVQDMILLVERLLAWSEESIRQDLAIYPDVRPETAIETRDTLLALVKTV